MKKDNPTAQTHRAPTHKKNGDRKKGRDGRGLFGAGRISGRGKRTNAQAQRRTRRAGRGKYHATLRQV